MATINTTIAQRSRPIRMWIDGKCFNLKPFRKSRKQAAPLADETELTEESLPDPGPNIEVDKEHGKLSTSFLLPSMYYIKLHQSRSIDIKNVSQETQTNISVPKHGSEGNITILGDSKENISLALEKIHSIVGDIRQQNSALQFLGIPLLSDEIKNNFEIFKEKILSEKDAIKGMHESIFQKASKLHLTVDVCVLQDNREKEEAINALNEYRDTILKPLLEKTGPLMIQVSGIDCMNSNYENVNVLYAKASIVGEDEKVTLQHIMNTLSNCFYQKGFLKKYQENVKVHMTLLNTKYRDSPAGSPKRWVRRKPFDARRIMENYKDFNFGLCKLDNIRLCVMSSLGDDGFYKCLSEIRF